MKKALLFFAFLFLIVTINGLIASIHNLVVNTQAVSSLTVNVKAANQEHNFLTQQLQYVQTADFVEEEARNKLGMVKPGENIIIAPPPPQKKLSAIPIEIPNWEKWMKLFL